MKKFVLITFLSFALFFNFCSSESVDSTNQNLADSVVTVQIFPDRVHQTIENFGASDAWSCQFVGKNWPQVKKERIADLLFSTETDEEGNPLGIGLSLWRFNIGAGSMEQGSQSDIVNPWRRAECFMNADGSYNWSKQAGQRWFLRAAKRRGVEQFIGFVNSPPVHLTKNGLAHASGGNSANIAEENFPNYADFLARVVKNVEEKDNVHLDYISPFNEPQWDWDDSNQEGCPWKNSQIAAVCRLIDSTFRENNIDSKIEIPETANNAYLYSYGDKPERGNQIEEFFKESSENYVGDLEKMPAKLGGHSYFSTYPDEQLIQSRERLKNKLNSVNPELKYWMTEYCNLADNELIRGSGRDLGMKPALYISKVIHADLTITNASAWQWWLGVSPYDYKDGLVYIDKDKSDGEIYESKMLWALGHFSRFIRPGMQRIGVEYNDKGNTGQTMISAYQDTQTNKYVIVVTNQRYSDIKLDVDNSNLPQNSEAKLYRTTSEEGVNLTNQGVENLDQQIAVPARSLLTIVID
ncbi:MAG: xylanase [Candidatus Marinimicrobia bacterium]|nr:xylanase [Candidatus Neomarinimicrobiota bacterium]